MMYCLPKSELYPYESLWSIIQKLVHWNACNWSEIVVDLHKNRHLRCEGRFKSLLYYPPWDFNRLATGLNIDIRSIRQGVVNELLPGAGRDVLVCDYLRYCPKCIKAGYHSIIHQLYIFDECPYHRIPLKQTCPRCDFGVSLAFDAEAINNYYACNRCGEMLNPFTDRNRLDRGGINSAFGQIFEVLEARANTMVKCAGLNRYLPEDASESKKRDDYAALWLFWESLYGGATNLGVEVISFKDNQEPGKILHNYRNAYISNLKLLHEKFLKKHAYCVEIILKDNNSLFTYKQYPLKEFCQVAYALIVWRMFWEAGYEFTRVCTLGHLDVSEQKITEQVAWVHKCVVQENIAAEIFKYECESTWKSSLIFSRIMIEKGIFYIPCSMLPKSVMSHWEVVIDRNSKILTLAKIPLPANNFKTEPVTSEHIAMMDEFVNLQNKHRKSLHLNYHPRG